MKLKILCIDDSKSVHAFLKTCVSDVALEFKSAFDGEQGLDFLAQESNAIDLVFLDWEMPKKTGPEVLIELKRRGFSKPIIMLTSKNQVSDITEALGNGAADYIMKPFTKDIILEKISMIPELGQ